MIVEVMTGRPGARLLTRRESSTIDKRTPFYTPHIRRKLQPRSKGGYGGLVTAEAMEASLQRRP